MDINNILESGDVERFHSNPGITKQRNSEHQWGVAMLAQYFNPKCRKEVLLSAMTHDAPEMITGDLPATFKWSNPEVKPFLDKFEKEIEIKWGINFELDEGEKFLLKVCDMLEGMQYCIKRFKCGEINAQIPFFAWTGVIRKSYLPVNGGITMTEKQVGFFNNLLGQMIDLGGKDGS